MACHTYFYRKIERTQEEAKKLWIDAQKKSIERWEEIVNNSENKYREIYFWTQQDCAFQLAVLKRQLRMVQNDFCKKAIWNNQPDKELSVFVDGKGLYINDRSFNNCFRKYTYSDVQLFSLQETLDYIHNPENDCLVFEDTIQKITEFWNKYPDGFIEF